ncbi:hypothetical protein GLYMA_03G157600v4 [Glycine max]|uniref:Uncharacterized protein n=2 Tax=Glycine subgen. Soja TaxID=1462606 RepID=I1JNY0_SOYBN|nr:hypothetical protein JHK87_007453 [Glycine soja]KAG5055325.1 hypothetical protein JHK85_007835 [Glycine max]KAG5072395.1 hypothetical protein JHK86_007606 [Glycine max]KAH1070215.1 hypothetical protein GYH30_007362 [Glycine max]KRH67270.1 hypothetical protein GLYMA_03G157600v4 [Glycine max]
MLFKLRTCSSHFSNPLAFKYATHKSSPSFKCANTPFGWCSIYLFVVQEVCCNVSFLLLSVVAHIYAPAEIVELSRTCINCLDWKSTKEKVKLPA